MATINLAVTVELNDDLTADEISALASDLVVGLSRAGSNEMKTAISHVRKPGLTATVNVKVLD